ncbi:AraC-like DNA-binding protein [Flavobacterium arsenatis]|uniref:AraC-like DNA-binding protein n=1 Tax=Flavobacterium arsenatis TaxID=1484332 RepID=A0ABU1TMS7_9FLAO|nr:helix-turn-helix domain-containing protein [Flavobacterium arsenatis]MDR6967276.1 AraC-like DNA-binding protein [Flavobacterium arsenatis]
MNFQSIEPHPSISLFVKNILIFESADKNIQTSLPFFADGYPGLMFNKTDNGLIVNPHQKMMPILFLYGQTVKPIELEISGAYEIIIFQLYPFVLKSFFNILPQTITDNCYDLQGVKEFEISVLTDRMLLYKDVAEKVEGITSLLYQFFEVKKQNIDLKIKQVIERIIASKGQENILFIADELRINSRTLERRFLNEVGLSPKQFAKIIQFQSSLQQLAVKDFTKLTDIVYENGFSDQSHFIKVFKAFTGKTPKTFTI